MNKKGCVVLYLQLGFMVDLAFYLASAKVLIITMTLGAKPPKFPCTPLIAYIITI